MQYMTLRSRPLELEITPDAKGGGGDAYVVQGRGMSKEEVKMLGQDIRFIKLGNAQLRPVREPFLSGLPTGGCWWEFWRSSRRSTWRCASGSANRQNAAPWCGASVPTRWPVQRFWARRALFMEEENRHAFYEEMLRALWGYMGDKFNIPVANLTKENVREELQQAGRVGRRCRSASRRSSRKCDEAQYSPAASAQMSEVYAEGVDIISRIEAVIKR